MPLTRQEVEALDFSFIPEDEENIRALRDGEAKELALIGNELGGLTDETWTLLAAAPELALACLEARTFAQRMARRHRDGSLGVAADDLLRALDAALALAGLEALVELEIAVNDSPIGTLTEKEDLARHPEMQGEDLSRSDQAYYQGDL